MKIAIFPNYEKEGTAALLKSVVDLLEYKGAKCIVSDESRNAEESEEVFSSADVIVTIGGDGTIIKQAKSAALFDKPCLGINTGRLGFLTNLEADQISLLDKLFTNEFTVESRMMLEVTVVNGDEVISCLALNDAVISGGRVARITDIDLDVSGDKINYVSDGLIISTPTGSTAYSLSAGGPIIDPSVRCITVTPICSHSLTARPMLAGETAVMTVTIPATSRTDAVLTVDGVFCGEIVNGAKVIIKKAPVDAKFINLSNSTIFKAISRKF